MKKRIQLHKISGALLALGLMFSIAMPVQAAVTQADIANPTRVAETHVANGTHTSTYNYVYFGMYPQREITGEELTDEIRNATYDGNCDAVVNGKKYRRLSYDMLHFVGTHNDMWPESTKKEVWDSYTTDGYRYFVYEPIKWKILNSDNGKMFLWSANVLDYRLVHKYNSADTWETCDLREWLNCDGVMSEDAQKTHNGAPAFYGSAFDEAEKNRILVTDVVQDDNPEYEINNGNNTQDKVFLLSFTEATSEKYGFCRTKPCYEYYQCGTGWMTGRTQYAAMQDDDIGDDEYYRVWLRTKGKDYNSLVAISPNSLKILPDGVPYYAPETGICPAINVQYHLSDCIRISFETNGAGTVEDQILLGAGYAKEPVTIQGAHVAGMEKKLVLQKEGYCFTGWYTDKACTDPYNFDEKLTQDTILYAGWKRKQDKPNGVTGGIMKIQGTTSAMEYASSTEEGTVWMPCQDGSTPTSTEGTWYVRYKETSDAFASEAVVVNVISVDQAAADYIAQNGISEKVVAITDEVILSKKDDKDIASSTYSLLQARVDKTDKKSVRLKWNPVSGADGYDIYGARCNTKSKKYKMQFIKTVKQGNKKTYSYTQKKRKKGTYYKYIVKAYKEIEGKKITIGVSKCIHATTTGGKYGNAKKVNIKTDKKLKKQKGSYTLSIKKNKKYTIKASEVKQKKKIQKHRAVAYETTDKSIATVTKKGVVKGKKKGTCYIYAYAQNGMCVRIKVKVK